MILLFLFPLFVRADFFNFRIYQPTGWKQGTNDTVSWINQTGIPQIIDIYLGNDAWLQPYRLAANVNAVDHTSPGSNVTTVNISIPGDVLNTTRLNMSTCKFTSCESVPTP